MARRTRKLAWFVAIWAMSVACIAAIGSVIRLAIVP
jgi:hypothetical protein